VAGTILLAPPDPVPLRGPILGIDVEADPEVNQTLVLLHMTMKEIIACPLVPALIFSPGSA